MEANVAEPTSFSSQRMPSTSRWFVGSSSSSTSGCSASAAAMARRFRHPPDSVPAFAAGSSKPTRLMIFETSMSLSSPSRADAAMTSRTVASGSKRGSCTTIASRTPLRIGDRSVVGRHAAAEDLQKGRLPRAVGADDAEPVAIMQAERNIGEYGARSERFRNRVAGQKYGHSGVVEGRAAAPNRRC